MNRLIKKHPELLTQDTLNLIIHDTVVIESVSHDTTTKLIFHDSTIIVNNEKVFAKYYYDTITREFHHYVECKGDTVTIIKEVPIIVDKVVIEELTWWEKYSTVIIISGVLLLFLILLKRFGKLLL
ncbi:MAG: hypothetical protein ACTSQK_10530 [Candidatus Heimdallarchaeota archaeon]